MVGESMPAIENAATMANDNRKVDEELTAADEAFLTSALLGVMTLTEIDGVPIGTTIPGPISRSLGMELEEIWFEHLA